MKQSWFSEVDGGVRFDEMAFASESFRHMMADGTVTDEELVAQSLRVGKLFQELDQELPDKLHDLVGKALTELAVLYAIQSHQRSKEQL